MRISDWSSDVCSSDLERDLLGNLVFGDAGTDQEPGEAGDVRRAGIRLGHDHCDRAFTGTCVGHADDRDFGDLRMAEQQVLDFLRSEEHTSELQSLMRISYAVFCLKKKNHKAAIRGHKRHHTRALNI